MIRRSDHIYVLVGAVFILIFTIVDFFPQSCLFATSHEIGSIQLVGTANSKDAPLRSKDEDISYEMQGDVLYPLKGE